MVAAVGKVDRLMLAELLGAKRERRTPQPDGTVGLRALSIVLAAQEPAPTCLPVDLAQRRLTRAP